MKNIMQSSRKRGEFRSHAWLEIFVLLLMAVWPWKNHIHFLFSLSIVCDVSWGINEILKMLSTSIVLSMWTQDKWEGMGQSTNRTNIAKKENTWYWGKETWNLSLTMADTLLKRWWAGNKSRTQFQTKMFFTFSVANN